MLIGCASIAPRLPVVPSQAFDQPELTTLGQRYHKRVESAAGESGFHLLVSGPDAFASLAALAESVEKALDLQYYIVAKDSTATLLLESALRAAERGVLVRLLLDDMNAGAVDPHLEVLASHPNVQVRLFNPFSQRGRFGLSRLLELLGNSDRLNRRMHNKLWIADGAVAVMGGRNLGDSYFHASQDTDFADLDVLAAGPVVAEMSRSFDQYWNSGWALPFGSRSSSADAAAAGAAATLARSELAQRARAFRDSDYARALRATAFGAQVREAQVPLIHAPAQVLYDPPSISEEAGAQSPSAIFAAMREQVRNAKRELILVSPYLVPGEAALELWCSLARRGVRVRILTNSLVSTDVPVVHAGYARYRPRLLACGVALHELRPDRISAGLAQPGDTQAGLVPPSTRTRFGFSSGASLHTKAVVVDGAVSFIGSMNLDPRSRYLNSEVALMISSTELGARLSRLFDEATTLDQAFSLALAEPGQAASQLSWSSIEEGRLVRRTEEPQASVWLRWAARILGILAPESLL